MKYLSSFLYLELLLLLCLAVITCRVACATYSAGVVEFSPETLQPEDSPPQLILRNAQRYVGIINSASQHGVDILVFPECGLTSIHMPLVRDLIVPYLTEIPEVGTNPCDLPEVPQVLKSLSCAARNNSIYVVFNLDELAHCAVDQTGCPSDGHLFYNTNLALDRNGMIIARYRKFNLFVEPEFNSTKIPDQSWFDTDFGVRFGMFICFDIMFNEPTFSLISHLNISNFVYSTAWFSELPLLTATAVQAGWAYSYDVNLLAAGYNNPSNRNAGSGIYAGRDGTLIVTMPDQTSTKLLIARVSSDQRGVTDLHTEEITYLEDHTKKMNFFHSDMSYYKNILITNKNTHLEYENEGFKCNVNANISLIGEGDRPVYRLVAYSGIRSYNFIRTVRFEVCGVVACANKEIRSCGHKPSFSSSNIFDSISINAYSDKELLSYPITANSELMPISSKFFKFNHDKSDKKSNMRMYIKSPQNNLLAFALFRNG